MAVAAAAYPVNAKEWYSYAMHGISTSLLIMDWAQSREIAMSGGKFVETNPMLGRRPALGRVNAYFATAITLNTVIGNALPGHYATFFHVAVASVQANAVAHNASIGVGMKF